MQRREPTCYEVEIGCERLEQERTVRESEQKYVVAAVEVEDELRDCRAQPLDFVAHAARRIGQDSDRNGGIVVLLQEVDCPAFIVDIDTEIAFFQASNVAAILIRHS